MTFSRLLAHRRSPPSNKSLRSCLSHDNRKNNTSVKKGGMRTRMGKPTGKNSTLLTLVLRPGPQSRINLKKQHFFCGLSTGWQVSNIIFKVSRLSIFLPLWRVMIHPHVILEVLFKLMNKHFAVYLLRWLETVSSTFQDVDLDGSL